MNIEQLSEVQRKIQNLLEGAEKERAQKRIGFGLAELRRGKVEYLTNNELLTVLPSYIKEIWDNKSWEEFEALLQVLESGCLSEDVLTRERAIALMSISASLVVQGGTKQQVVKVGRIISGWMEREDKFLAGYETVALQLEQLIRKLFQAGSWGHALSLAQCILDISTGKMHKVAPIVSVASRAQEKIADTATIKMMLKAVVQEGTAQDEVHDIRLYLLNLKGGFVPTALELLEEVPKDWAESLVVLLAQVGKSTVREIEKRFEFGSASDLLTRRMVKILSRIDDDTVWPRLTSCLQHSAIEVQQEVLIGIPQYGPHSAARLMEALPIVDDRLKVLVIKRLSQFPDDEINNKFLTMLSGLANEERVQNRGVVSALIVTLSLDGRAENLSMLQGLKDRKIFSEDSVLQGILDASLGRLKIALRRIEHRVREEGTIEFSSDPVRIEQTREKLAETIKKVKSLAEQGRVDQALDLLKSSILTSLRVSQLSAAEMLRDMVLEVDPRAIETLLEIEGHMNKPTINGQRYHDPLVWHDLERCIGSSALTRLFELSAQECYQPGETIIAQHEQGDSLFLVNSGTVSMHCGSGSKEVFLKKLHSGAILGAETVFEVSLATVSVRAETVVRLFAFSAESLDILEKDFPGSRKTIRNHCRDQINVLKLLKMSAADRRRDVRYKIEKKVETKISDMYGVVGPRTLMGCLHDISYGGVCYTIGIDSSRGLQRLLGRQMQVIFNLRDLGRVELLGEFVAFDRSVDNDNTYLVHVRTFEPIDPKVYEIIVQNSD